MSRKLYVVSGPSGAGISDIAAAVFAKRDDVSAVTPVTARKMRAGEVNGVGFYFYDLDGWKSLKEAGGLLECTEFAGNDYGTSREFVVQLLDAGKNVLLSLEPDRAAQVKQNFPAAVCIWVEPSDETLLRERFSQRARSEREIEVRLRAAAEQRAASGFCDLRIADDDPATTLRTLNEAIEA
jgi:guanylate kinase